MGVDGMTDQQLINFIIDVRAGLRLAEEEGQLAIYKDFYTNEPDRPQDMAAFDEAETLLRAGEREAGIAKLCEAYGKTRGT